MRLSSGYESKRARVEMLPLIDVVFLLLVFFIYAMISMVVHHGLPVNLPGANHSEIDKDAYLAISITAENKLYLNEVAIDMTTLHGAIQKKIEEKGADLPIYIEGDTNADLGIAIHILDELKGLGVENVSFSCSENSTSH